MIAKQKLLFSFVDQDQGGLDNKGLIGFLIIHKFRTSVMLLCNNGCLA